MLSLFQNYFYKSILIANNSKPITSEMTKHVQGFPYIVMVYIPELSISRGTTEGVTQQNVFDEHKKDREM